MGINGCQISGTVTRLIHIFLRIGYSYGRGNDYYRSSEHDYRAKMFRDYPLVVIDICEQDTALSVKKRVTCWKKTKGYTSKNHTSCVASHQGNPICRYREIGG